MEDLSKRFKQSEPKAIVFKGEGVPLTHRTERMELQDWISPDPALLATVPGFRE